MNKPMATDRRRKPTPSRYVEGLINATSVVVVVILLVLGWASLVDLAVGLIR